MKYTITINIDTSVLEHAEQYAKQTGRSLSDMAEEYLRNITNTETEIQLSPKLQSLVGVVHLPQDFDEKKELDNYYLKKHLKA
jgi:hypothetical protein